MPYRKGRPIIDRSIFFRVACALTFYPIIILAYAVYLVLYRSRIIGRTKLQKIKKAILVSNHTTFLDPVLMSAVVFPRCTYHTLLEETVLCPFLGTLCRLLGGVPVPMGIRALHNLPQQCEKGFAFRRYIHFYPEGECYLHNQDVQAFHPGAFLVAAESDIPIVPLATVFRPRNGGKKPQVFLYVLDPINPKDFQCKNENTGEVNLRAVRRFAEHTRTVIQNEIDKQGGTRRFNKGAMKRIAGINN
ncbi:MAG: 1-acyl-sn-glycerol-3-phosphate acyltransferase [Spirochaetales bacterium]